MIQVLSPGLQTTVQDAGRPGFRHLGVGTAGAADHGAWRLGNLLVGNAGGEASLEIALLGPRLRFDSDCRIALTGATTDAASAGRRMPHNQAFDVRAGTSIDLGRCRGGARSYLAVHGGIEVEVELGSRSTDLRAGFGGVQGRALRRGDSLRAGSGALPDTPAPSWWVARPDDATRRHLPADVLRILLEPEFSTLGGTLPSLVWRIESASNRQALQLSGPCLSLSQGGQRISAPVCSGGIQLLPGGEPLLLGADAQTCGGYPLLGGVIAADLDQLAQRRPGETLRFQPVDLAVADAAQAALDASWTRLELAVAARRRATARQMGAS